MSSWVTRRWEKLSKCTRIFKLSSRLPIKMLIIWGLKAWIQANLRKKSTNWSKKKSNCSPRSTFSKTRVIRKIFMLSSRQPPNLEKSKSRMPSLMRRSGNWPIWLSSMNKMFWPSNKDSSISKRSRTSISLQTSFLIIWELTLEKTEISKTRSWVENSMTREKDSRGSNFFFRSQWQHRMNSRGSQTMSRECRKSAWCSTKSSRSTLQLMTNLAFSSLKQPCWQRRRTRSKLRSRSLKWKSRLLRRAWLTRRANMPEPKVESTWRETISDNMPPTSEVKIPNTSRWKRCFPRSSLK